MDTLYLVLIIGILNIMRVSASYFGICVQPVEEFSMFFNDIKIANGYTYMYKSGTNLTVSCKSEKKSNNVLTIVRTYNLQQNHGGATKNIQKHETIDDGSPFKISHTFDLSPNENGVKISCVRKNNGYEVAAILILKLERISVTDLAEMAPKRDKDFESTSFAMGVGVGAAMTIFFGLLCWLVIVCFPFKQPRRKLATPLPEEEYSSVYSWWKPAKPAKSVQPSKPLSDIPKALNIVRFTSKPELPSQPPPNVPQNLSNCKVPPNYTPLSQSPPAPPSLPPPIPPDITQSSQNLRLSPKPALPSQPAPNLTPAISNLTHPPKSAQPPPDVTQFSRNLRLPTKPTQPLQSPPNFTQTLPNCKLMCLQPFPDITETCQSLRFTSKSAQQTPEARTTLQSSRPISKPSLSPRSPDLAAPKFSVSKMHITKLESTMRRN